MMFMNKLILAASLRGLVTAVSGIAVGKGWASGDEVQTAIAALTGLASLGYSIYTRTAAKQIAATESLPNVSHVVKK